jgi:gliding motility-associated-like protein
VIGCNNEVIQDSAIVEVFPYPGLHVSEGKTINLGQIVTLAATTIDPLAQISWENENTNEHLCDDCPAVVQQPEENTTYKATAINEVGCVEENTVLITVEDLCDVGDIEVMNAFTPNGDGQNDYFEVRNTGESVIKTLQIFNRWGELVFESYYLDPKWDGTFRGVPLNPAVFMYVMEGECVNKESFRIVGNITLIR